jgi:mono/diheme cytochrome c family protein
MRLTSFQTFLLCLFALLLLVVTGWLLHQEVDHSWKDYQSNFIKTERDLLLEKLQQVENLKTQSPGEKSLKAQARLINTQLASNRKKSAKIDQVWLEDIKRADRCLTCHNGLQKEHFKNVTGVFARHPGDFLKTHPVKDFGCTLCHDGDGMGLTVESGHGENEHWNHPLLRGEMVEASCRKCHSYTEQIPQHISFPQAATLTQGKNLYIEKGCLGCHELEGFVRPESVGPLLNRVGEKVNSTWLKNWLKRPKDYLPNTIMPFFDLPPAEISALTDFLLTQKNEDPIKEKPHPSADPQQGEKLVNTIGCLGCHSVKGKGGTFAPDLSRVGEKTDYAWEKKWLAHPKDYDPTTVMPDFRLQESQIRDIAAYLLTLGKTAKATEPTTPGKLVSEGRKLFAQRGCTGCHSLEGFAKGFKKAPEHTGFGDKRVDELDFGNVNTIPRTRAAWVLAKEKSPRIFTTETIKLIMPNFELTDEEAKALRVFVLSFTKSNLPERYKKDFWNPSEPYLAGMKVIEENNCIGCHKIGLNRLETELTDNLAGHYHWVAENYAVEDAAEDEKKVLHSGQVLSDRQFKGIVEQHPDWEAKIFRNRWFFSLDAADYLKLDMGIKSARIAGKGEGQILRYYRDLNFGPPILNYEGVKVQPDWLFDFLKGPYPIRPLTKATMATFNLSDQNIVDLVGFFQANDAITHNPFFTTRELDTIKTDTAEKIFKVCLQCHYYDQERTTDKKRFGALKGPNLAEVKRRLRPEYIKQWIKYPDLVIPGTQMKNFFYYFDLYERFEELENDETGFPEIPADEKIDMMSKFLMNPFKGQTLSSLK